MKTVPKFLTLLATTLILASCGSHENVATVASESAVTSATGLEGQTLHHVNRFRKSQGLSPLQLHPGLQKLALEHSRAMQKKDLMEHFGFKRRAKIAQKKYQMGAVSENLHRSWGFSPDGKFITEKWKNSPKHRKNMKGNFNYAGLAIVQQEERLFTTLLLGQGVGANAPQIIAEPYLSF